MATRWSSIAHLRRAAPDAARTRRRRSLAPPRKSARSGMIQHGRPANVAAMNTHIHFDIGSSTIGQKRRWHSATRASAPSCPAIPRVRRARVARAVSVGASRAGRRAAGARVAAGRRIRRWTRSPGLPLDPAGTEFQQRVWRALRGVPSGETVSYAEIARRIEAPKSFRAVAQACGANPIALVIPCHRVVRH